LSCEDLATPGLKYYKVDTVW